MKYKKEAKWWSERIDYHFASFAKYIESCHKIGHIRLMVLI